ncbi:MAG: DNA repair protein RecO [Gammaproteobacteria bacterium]
MRIAIQPAFILHHRPYRETSLILDLLTQDHGRLSVIARGVRTARSRTRALLQPFTPLLVTWQGKSELMTMGSVEAQGAPIQLRGDCLLSAFYLNELLIRILHKHDPHPKLYTIYQETLLELQDAQLAQKTLRLFEKKLLEELGYGHQLQYDISHGNPFVAEQNYQFFPEQGFELYQEGCIVAEAFIFSGKSLIALEKEQLDDEQSLRDAKRLMRLLLAPLLGSQPLQSRKLFLEVEKAK